MIKEMLEFKNLDCLIENIPDIVLKTSVHNSLIIRILCNQRNQWMKKRKNKVHVYCPDKRGGEGVISMGGYIKKEIFYFFVGKGD